MECKKYLLQGITTLNDTVYVCRRTGGDLIELDDAPKARDQWWRLSYNPHDQKKPGTAEVRSSRLVVVACAALIWLFRSWISMRW